MKQPWTWAIACAGKTVENRSRPTSYRGLLAIHASKGYDEDAVIPDASAAATLRRLVAQIRLAQRRTQESLHLAAGAIIAVAELDGCHYHADCLRSGKRGSAWGTYPCSAWAMPGQFHWTLTRVRPLAEPVPCKGALGIWTVPEDAESAVRAQLEASHAG